MCDENYFDDEALGMEETLYDFIISKDENPFDLDTRMDALDAPFSFGDDNF